MSKRRSYLPDSRRWLAVAVPAGLAILLIGGLACLLLAMSVRQANDLVIQRDRNLAASVLQQALQSIARDQESVTAWDEAVLHLRDPIDLDWLDDNIGLWMNMYFGHERIVVLDPQDRPIYATIGNERVDPATYQEIAPVVRPMIAAVRRALIADDWRSTGSDDRSPGAKDILVIGGHPAMVGVKPVVPSTAKVRQAPQDAYLHLAVHYLDGSFLKELQQHYLFKDARFSWQDSPKADELSYGVVDKQGRSVGFLIWKVQLPGQILTARMAPALLGTLLAILLVVAVLVAGLRKGARALRASEARARHLAYHDVLTGLPNRACFNERLASACAAGAPGTSLMLLDLDRFKQVNDTLGHPAGDALIRAVGARLRQAAPDGATVARLGGDEFAILTPRMAPAHVATLCETIIAAIGQPFEIHGAEADVGVSIGVAAIGRAATPDVMIRRADRALYRAKRAGGGFSVAGDDLSDDGFADIWDLDPPGAESIAA
ncbi:diguanylate cyclase domain-containing protein [Jiella pacifica]|uniref:Diguanylate cyclase n=1 Tax=Jiella pacifica TaxID=2696469 RepID=A0A6N9SXD1_9HYPH|nr:diguanylate cyclase [Jiella pacifica]NDW02962.1 diguanylate cyclase [Jiella pacifica]